MPSPTHVCGHPIGHNVMASKQSNNKKKWNKEKWWLQRQMEKSLRGLRDITVNAHQLRDRLAIRRFWYTIRDRPISWYDANDLFSVKFVHTTNTANYIQKKKKIGFSRSQPNIVRVIAYHFSVCKRTHTRIIALGVCVWHIRVDAIISNENTTEPKQWLGR